MAKNILEKKWIWRFILIDFTNYYKYLRHCGISEKTDEQIETIKNPEPGHHI